MREATMLVLRRDGRLHLALKATGADDARRWADEGYQVFLVASAGERWAINHVNTGRIVTSEDDLPPEQGAAAGAVVAALLENKGEAP